jgi:acetyl-CoA synthetase
MTAVSSYSVAHSFSKTAHINTADYHTLYQQSIDDPSGFWSKIAKKFVTWFTPWTHTIDGDFSTHAVRWFTGATLNACYNCVDRHLDARQHQPALIFEGNHLNESRTLTYAQLHNEVCRFANVLKHHGIKKGDRVGIYLPMIPEAVISMLACARIGAIHSVIFGGFSAEALQTRLIDADCHLLITANEGLRGNKVIPFKDNCDKALIACANLTTVIVVQHTKTTVSWHPERDHWYHEEMASADSVCPVAHMDANDPLFILYTSGSTGQPKGVLHSTGGYLVYVTATYHDVFNHHEGDIHWCTADVGWITGHSYCVYGPLSNGATTVLYEGIPNYPDYSRYWRIIESHQVTSFYTAPTALRALRREGDAWVKQCNRSSLNLLGSVGEPIDASVWEWYYHIVGEERCPIVNTWWQTETGGILFTALPGATPLVAGTVGVPFFGIQYDLVNDAGVVLQGEATGKLVINAPWPGLMLTLYGNNERFLNTYFKPVPGRYLTGDSAHRNNQGHLWITGRDDDVINVSGHRLGSGELESALIAHPAVSEAAVVGIPHDIKGEGIFAFITTKPDTQTTDYLKQELKQHLRDKIGALATLDGIQWVESLPKTRSGKIMRRILRNIANNNYDDLGDLSTLANAEIIETLIKDKT